MGDPPDDEIDAGWVTDAVCRGMDPDVFHPRNSEGVDAARGHCARCPVAVECLDHALRVPEPNGVWGGASERERRRMRKVLGWTNRRPTLDLGRPRRVELDGVERAPESDEWPVGFVRAG